MLALHLRIIFSQTSDCSSFSVLHPLKYVCFNLLMVDLVLMNISARFRRSLQRNEPRSDTGERSTSDHQ